MTFLIASDGCHIPAILVTEIEVAVASGGGPVTTDLAGMSEREYFALVAKRLGLFVIGSRLAAVEGFLDGYDQHALRHGGPGLRGWREWLVARRGQDCDHAWHGQVRHIALPEGWKRRELTREEEAKVIDVLFMLLDEFLAERERSALHGGQSLGRGGAGGPDAMDAQ
ncbi:hypothetical protein [Nonomuraea sp. NPDC048826]|uniref:hypothetical protein n=1 Tax=Nonomuraea sp. NPDC048826 TaxID=3364347 RepID=UPI0037100790